MQNPLEPSKNKSSTQKARIVDTTNTCKRAWLEVDPKAIEANTSKIKKILSKNCILMAVVKADGYGHGAVNVAKAAIKGGAKSLGIATLKEGIELRKADIKCPILLLGNLIDEDELEACIDWSLMPTICNIKEALICEKLGRRKRKQISVQIKLDTGMTRLGCDLKEGKSLFNEIENSNYLKLEGIYSHLALADISEDLQSCSFTQEQQSKFDQFINKLPNITNICCHLANSAGTLSDQSLHYNMVRVGLAIYGYSPIEDLEKKLKLKPALSVKARITLIRNVDEGIGVSYGHKFVTKRPSRLAVVAIGYADGINRLLSGKISVLCKSHRLPQVGAITMDQLLIDITDFADIQLGDVVTLLGLDGELSITPTQWGSLCGSITWEILCGFKHRLPRIVI